MKHRAILISGVFIFVTNTYAQTQFTKPSFIKRVEGTMTQAGPKGEQIDITHQNIAKKLMGQIKNSNYRNLDEGMQLQLLEAMMTNKAVRDTVNEIIVRESAQTQEHQQINLLKLEILSQFKEADPYNQETNSASAGNPSLRAELDIVRLVTGVRGTGFSPEALNAVKLALTEIKTSLLGGAPKDKILELMRDSLSIDKGIDLEIRAIGDLANRGQIMELFKGANDVAEVVVQGPGGQPLVVRLSGKEAEAMETVAYDQAQRLIQAAQNPKEIMEKWAADAVKNIDNAKDSVEAFLKQNSILDRQSRESQASQEALAKVATTMDDLLRTLAEMGGKIESNTLRGKAADWARKIPGVNKFVGDSVTQMKTLKEKVQAIDKTLVDDILLLDANNKSLTEIKMQALDRINTLHLEMARVKLLSDYLNHYAEQLSSSDPKAANIIKSQIMTRIERELNGSMTLYGVLNASIEGINAVIQNNLQIMADANILRSTGAPAIAVTQTVSAAAAEAKATAQRHQKISQFLETELTRMSAKVKEVNEITAKMAGEPIISPEVLSKVIDDLVVEREAMAKRMVESGKKLRSSNEKLMGVINKAQEMLDHSQVGVGVELMLKQPLNNNKN